MIKKIALGLAAAIVIVLVVASFQSDRMQVTRSAVIPAPPAAVFGVVNDFSRWLAWSPWADVDPAMKSRLEGPTKGVGAQFHWEGNAACGAGVSHLTESRENELVAMRIDMTRPMEGSTEVRFTFAPDADGTRVTWSMEATKPFLGKVMSLFMDCEKQCGDDFDKGLANLAKVVTETPKS